jgi:hypothetical protein
MQLSILPLCIFDDLASVLEGVLERVTFGGRVLADARPPTPTRSSWDWWMMLQRNVLHIAVIRAKKLRARLPPAGMRHGGRIGAQGRMNRCS